VPADGAISPLARVPAKDRNPTQLGHLPVAPGHVWDTHD
jgi:hypothetical protein